LNAKKACPGSGLWFEDRGIRIPKSQIRKTPRVGVSYAGTVWAKKRYRFILST
jgi:DNA-3-methyladenine glycosylase